MRCPVNDQQSKRVDIDADLVVIGSGVAGITAALRAAALDLRVLIVTKGAVEDGNTQWAQGGVAVVRPDEHDPGDSVDSHVADTVSAGAGLCDADAVRSVLDAGQGAVRTLRANGACFDARGNGVELARAREGGHSAFRVIHAGGDATGAEIQRSLVAAASVRGISILERHAAVDALLNTNGSVSGVLLLDSDGVAGVVRAPAVLLATGGIGQLFPATSNPEPATGDGLALALRAGATLADMEFVQFHPTVLYTPDARGRCPLVTEAVRGEGATLIDAEGTSVLRGVHPLGDLAPRDVVSAAITRRMAQAARGIDDHVLLDATMIDGFPARFPTVYAACRNIGVDPTREPIPVTPAAHFSCGGVVTGCDGRTDVPGLYAAGEVARTGLHGANRLASNSLLEGLVMGTRTAETAAADIAERTNLDFSHRWQRDLPGLPIAERETLQRVMGRYAAIGRDVEGLATAGSVLDLCTTRVQPRSVRDVEDAALTLVAQALRTAAAGREESRGCHVRDDYPKRDDANWQKSQFIRLNPSGQPVLGGPSERMWVAA